MTVSSTARTRAIALSKVCINVAGITCLIETSNKTFADLLRRKYSRFLLAEDSELSLRVEIDQRKSSRFYRSRFKTAAFGNIIVSTGNIEADVNLVEGRGEVSMASLIEDKTTFNLFGVFLASLYAIILLENKGILLHSSGVVKDGVGYVFYGSSGTGKTTIAGLSSPYCVLNDDRIAVRTENGTTLMFDTPFWDGGQGQGDAIGFPVKGIFIPRKDGSSCYLKKLNPQTAVSNLMAMQYGDLFSQCLYGSVQPRDSFRIESNIVPRNNKLCGAIFDICCELAQKVPAFYLYFTKDGTKMWRCIDALG